MARSCSISVRPARVPVDTTRCGFTQVGAYQRLLNVYYTQGGPLPANLDVLGQLVGAHLGKISEQLVKSLRFIFTAT